MSLFQLRPTFEIPLAAQRLEVIAKLEAAVGPMGTTEHAFMHGEYGELHLPPAEHRLWSPHLSFYVAERDGQAVIYGRFAPRMEVWTFVWVIYLAMAFTAFFGLALAYSQWMLGEAGWGLWAAAGAALVISVLYCVASIGQQWSADQMAFLRQRLESILQAAGVISRSALASGSCENRVLTHSG